MHECFLKTSAGAATAFLPAHMHCLSCFLCYFPSAHTRQEISNFFLEQISIYNSPHFALILLEPSSDQGEHYMILMETAYFLLLESF